MDTTENNILIAEFMDTRKRGTYNYFYYIPAFERVFNSDELKFNSSWDWLIPVVEKIESLGFRIEIVKHICRLKINDNINIVFSENMTKIESVYFTVIEFIKWYNENSAKKD